MGFSKENITAPDILGGNVIYTKSIKGQIARINDLHEIIRNKASDLGLTSPSGYGSNKDSAEILITPQKGLPMIDTAAAIHSIIKNSDSDVTLTGNNLGTSASGSASVTVPAGYYPSKVTKTVNITSTKAETSGVQGSHTAGLNYITVTGTNITSNGYITTDANTTTTINLEATDKTQNPLTIGCKEETVDDITTKYLTLTPEQGFYTKDAWVTNVKYMPIEGELTITIIESTATGETTAEGFIVRAGYYPNDFTVKPAINGIRDDLIININPRIGELTAQSGNLSGAGNGFNYFSGTAHYEIQQGSITSVTASGPTATNNTITFGGGETTEGWISDNVTKPNTITLTTVTLRTSDSVIYKDPDNLVTPELTITPGKDAIYVPKETWTGKGIKINPISYSTNWTHSMSGPTLASSAITSTGTNSGNVTANHWYVNLNVNTAGYAPTGNHYKDIGTSITPTASSSKTEGTNPTNLESSIDSNTVYITIKGNYQAGTSYYLATVRNADSFSITSNTSAVTIGSRVDATSLAPAHYPVTASITSGFGTAGWIDTTSRTVLNVQVGKIAASGHSISGYADNNYGGSTSITSNVTELTNQYLKDTRIAGYTPYITTYYKVQAASGTPQNDGRYIVTTAGWINTGTYGKQLSQLTANNFTITNDSSNASITAITNLQFKIEIPKESYTPTTAISKVYKVQDMTTSTPTTSGGNIYYGKVNRAGWIGTDYYVTTSAYNEGSAKTITPNNSPQTISGGTYIALDVTILAVNAGEGMINSDKVGGIQGSSTYTPANDDDANTPTYFTTFTVDVSGIITQLENI